MCPYGHRFSGLGCPSLEPNLFHLRASQWYSGKESTCQCRRHKRCRFNPRVGKIPWCRKWQPTPAFLPGKSQGQRSLAGYSPWGCIESYMTEHTCTPTDIPNELRAKSPSLGITDLTPACLSNTDLLHSSCLGCSQPHIVAFLLSSNTSEGLCTRCSLHQDARVQLFTWQPSPPSCLHSGDISRRAGLPSHPIYKSTPPTQLVSIMSPCSGPSGHTSRCEDLFLDCIPQQGQHIFLKGPESKYFRLCWPYGLCYNNSTLPFSLKPTVTYNM